MFNNKKIHFIGIGGISMSGIVQIVLSLNALVSGTDTLENNMTKKLQDMGLDIRIGHHPEMIKDADIVVYTAAVPSTDPEIVAAKEENKILMERAEFLGKLTKNYNNCLCVSGTHGKSTTSGMLSTIFLEANLEPTIQIGAVIPQINNNTYIGKNDYFVMEACEFVDSFLHFYPTSAIVLNIDNDHLDYFKNLDNIKLSFKKFVNLIPSNGYLVINNDDENSKDFYKEANAKIITFGINSNSDYTAKNITCNDLGNYSFSIYKNNEFLIDINLNIKGKHNIYNALAAFSLSNQYISDINIIKTGLEKYSGVERRFQFIGKINGALIFDDYAHHPSEIKTTLESAKSIKHNKDYAIFQSHTFSRTKEHFNEFVDVLSKFDNVIVTDIYAAREINTFNVSAEDMANEIRKINPNTFYIKEFSDIIKFIKENVKEQDLVITIGAGDITKVAHELKK